MMIMAAPIIAAANAAIGIELMKKNQENQENHEMTAKEKERNERMKIIALQEESLSGLFKSWEKQLKSEKK